MRKKFKFEVRSGKSLDYNEEWFISRDRTIYCALRMKGFSILEDDVEWDEKEESLSFKIKVIDIDMKNVILEVCNKFMSRNLALNTFQYDRFVTEFKRLLDKYRHGTFRLEGGYINGHKIE